MALREYKLGVSTSIGNAPLLVVEPDSAERKAAVLVYHGLGAEKEVQRKEMVWLAEAGFTAVGVDAPHHGERKDGTLDRMGLMDDANAHPEFIKIVRDAIHEIPALVEFCLQRFSPGVGISGISLGGFIAFGAVVMEPRLKASVPILGSPDWGAGSGRPRSGLRSLMVQAPVHFPEKFPPCALLTVTAGKDTSVAPQASRKFMRQLRKYYAACPEKLQYVEYPESEHIMREEDWYDLWKKTVAWFDRFLAPGHDSNR